MNKIIFTLILSFSFSLFVNAQKSPKRELRGAWITTHFGLDWPRFPAHTTAIKKDSLIKILDFHKAAGINTIYFQVRNQCDALYPSSIEPWSSTLTGTQGADPGWDPLQFVIEECRKRGLELHAWLNPYRAVATASQLNSFVPNHVAKQHPEWLLNNGSTITLNPGLPAVRDYIMSVITDITQRYDIDGIHFDDYFYPPAPVRDTATYNADKRGMTHADWRRDNINIFIKRVYEELAALKPWVKFGVSPSGIYRNGVSVGGSATSGSEHYSAVYADSKKWLQEKWVDYIAPQVYWHIGFSVADYAKLIPWWNNNAFNRHIYIGMASYKVNMTFGTTGNGPIEQAAWKIPTQYPNELRMNRLQDYQNVLGEIHFRTLTFNTNALSHRDSAQRIFYRKPALPPTMVWRDATPPQSPSSLTATKQANNNYVLNWTKPAATSDEMNKVRQFVIYRSESPVININDTTNIITITPTDVTTYTDANPLNKTYYYTVTSVDRLYNESTPSNVTDYVPPTITCLQGQNIVLDATCSSLMADYTSQAIVSDDVSVAANISVTQSPAAGATINGTGNTTVTLTATDASGKSTSCTFIVKAEDKEPPVLNVPSNISVGTDNNQCSAVVNYETTASDNCTVVTTDSDHPGGTAFAKGTTTVTVTATDGSGNKIVKTFTVTVNDSQPPVVVCAADVTANTDPGVCYAAINIQSPVVTDNCPGATVSGKRSDGEQLTAVYPKGTTTITWTATDLAGNTATCTQNILVEDKEKPVITNAYANPDKLFPPNNKMRDVKVFYKVTDNCETVTTALSVTSNEDRLNHIEDDEPGADYQVLDERRVKLRAARSGAGNGRIYTITITATDASGNIQTDSVKVTVPHDFADVITSSQASKTINETMFIKELQVQAIPNPTKGKFALVTNSGSSELLQFRVTDMVGRLIEIKKGVSANGTMLLGDQYAPGIYNVEVLQGTNKKVLKIIKHL